MLNRISLKSLNVVQLTTILVSEFNSPQVNDSLQLAAYAHDGMMRKECRMGAQVQDPYIIHPIRVAIRAARWGAVPEDRTVSLVCGSLLHDSVEDAASRIRDFTRQSDNKGALLLVSDPMAAKAVEHLTHDSNCDYDEYLKKLGILTLELLIKISDMVDNAGSIKYMKDSDPRKLKLAHKYLSGAMILHDRAMVSASAAGSLKQVQGWVAAAERIKQVHFELADIIRSKEG